MDGGDIGRRTAELLKEMPGGVELEAAAKTRTADEIKEAIDAGIKIIGENYVQEAAKVFPGIGRTVKWHFIGHLQKNKVKKAVEIFDMIETVDTPEIASEINKRSAEAGRVMPVLIEVNSGREERKFGVFPEDVRGFIEDIAGLENLRVMGLMTMGPFTGDPEEARTFFKETKKVFDRLREDPVPGAEMTCLSMGMTNSYKVAIEEGANLVRIGTRIFGER